MPKITRAGRHHRAPRGEPVGSVLPPEAIAARVEGRPVDLSFVPSGDARSRRPAERPRRAHVLRHSAAHVMAQAVCDLFPGRVRDRPAGRGRLLLRPRAPRSGLRDRPAEDRGPDARARGRGPAVRPRGALRAEALERFADQPYKREIVETLEEGEVAGGDTVTVYCNDGWSDLCLGPHVPSTGRLGAFKLTKLAGVLARRRQPHDAHADLRHRVGDAGRSRRVPEAARGGREARPPAARPRARPASSPDELGPGCGSGTRRAPPSASSSRTTCARSTSPAATTSS